MKKLSLLMLTLLATLTLSAQNIRYVSMKGEYANDGMSWATAKNNIQDAINDLVNNNLTGEVWVAEGTYYPTETTMSTSSPYYKAFKIPAGITVRGGFRGAVKTGDVSPTTGVAAVADYAGETALNQRQLKDDNIFGQTGKSGNLDGEAARSGRYVYETILCGDLNPEKKATLTFNTTKQQFDIAFYGNSYHVVWFAMNGFDGEGRALPLGKPAKLEGCIVEGGHAFNNDLSEAHPHVAYGGGIYMVANSFVYNCEVRNCDASRNGGGIYMDGGGIVRRTYVHKCQALGIGTEYGMGGGICEEGSVRNSKANPIVVAQSVVSNCVGRLGGGVGINAEKMLAANKYTAVINSTVVNNNTATVEAGGVYTLKGGGVASATIVRNRCNGSGVTLDGAITGRSGGLYCRDASLVGNTVIWGNKCEANKDIQYADSRSSLQDSEKTIFSYNALSNAEIVDWSKAEKLGVLSLDDKNEETDASKKSNRGYPLFENPTQFAGYLDNIDYTYQLDGEGKIQKGGDGKPIMEDKQVNWKVFSESALHHAGINTVDLDHDGLTPAPAGKSWDMQFGEFNSRCTMGAIISEEPEIDSNNDLVSGEAHFFVDPNYNFATHHDLVVNGKSWDLPTRFLGNVLEYISADREKDNAEQEFKDKKIFIHVKQGFVDNTDSYKSGRVRCTTIDIPSNVTILGSYNSQLIGTDLSLRNVVHTPTVISAQLMNNYNYNIAHLINIVGQHDVLIEGFKLSFANANSTELGNTNRDGAAITVVNSEDIKFRNIVVSNCTAERGAAVYADKSTVEFENCIFHNNQTATIDNSGIIYATNGSVLDFNHCDVLRNVGHASYLGSNGTSNHWQNSIFYGNMNRPLPDTNQDAGGGINYALAAFSGNTANATGAYCMFDAMSASFASQFGENDTRNQWQYDLQYLFSDGAGQGYPRFINPTKNAGVTRDGDQTYYGRGVSFEPHNNNPIVNMASHADIHTSWGKDLVDVTRDFGGLPDIGAVENHEANQFEEGENAYADGQKAYGDAYYVRDYSTTGSGTTMDTYDKSNTGDLTYNDYGKGIYNAAGELLDGASWEYAVNGNGMYYQEAVAPTDYNTVFKTKVTTTPGSFKGTFTLSSGGYYLYIDGTNKPAVTTNMANATHFEVEGVTTAAGMATGTKYVRYKVGTGYRYLYIGKSGSTYSVNTTTTKTQLTIGSGYTLKNNSRFYRVNNGSLSASSYSSNWTFTPDMNDDVVTAEEKPYKQDGTTEFTSARTTSVVANAPVTDPLKFHVYRSLEDYNNSTTKKTYKIKRQGSTHYLKNTDNYLYPDATKANGNDFILLQDGDYGKYYIYDTNTQKYIYYFTGTGGASHVRAGSGADKTTWWIEEVTTGVLNFISGSQPKNTDGDYAITVTSDAAVAASVGQTGSDDAKFVLVANAGYDVFNYQDGGRSASNVNGLQYAVNRANEKFSADHKEREVMVAKGIYTNKTAADGNNTVQQPYAYMMKDGVNVYGGFPEVGNPGMNERQPKEFETILQPQIANPFVTMKFENQYSGGPQVSSKNIDRFVVSNWGANAKASNANDQASVGRVLVQPNDFEVETTWDGFTLQHGYLNAAYRQNINQTLTGTGGLNPDGVKVAGGAGVLLMGNGALVNSIVKDNLIICVPRTNKNTKFFGDGLGNNSLYTNHIGGAGVFMTGTAAKAKVENCEISRNQLLTKAEHSSGSNYDHIWQYGAGLYQNGGNVYNTIIHDNTAAVVLGSTITTMAAGSNNSNEMILGAGAFVANGNFYNNTIVANTSATFYHAHKNHVSFSGVHVFDNARIYNSIIADNIGHWAYEDFARWGGTNPGSGAPVSAFKDNEIDRNSREPSKVNVKYSYVDVKKREVWSASGYAAVAKDMTWANDPDNTNIYLNYKQGEGYHADPQPANIYTSEKVYHKAGAVGTTDENRYHIFVSSPCFNSGTEAIKDASGNDVDIPDYDAEYTDRIKDCAIDIGAYEFNGAEAVTPQTTGAGVAADQAVFYVTPNGVGDRSGKDPANAACAAKLQTVLDAAGRYKYLNPGKQVIVKVANDKALQKAESDFTYYATRTTDHTDQDVRVWSIMVPRGVEVWGGYTDVPMKMVDGKVVEDGGKTWSNTYNGFYSGATDLRDITGNPTYFDSYYVNKLEKTEANTYHVVTFTDRIFDQNGLAYTKVDFDGKTSEQVRAILTSGTPSTYVELPGNDESLFAHMSEALTVYAGVRGNVIMADATTPKQIDGKYVSNRAVIDGIFVSGGQADASSDGTNTAVNINSYGGAALVNDFAYVRNCILTGNSATNGGALALTDHALVSGCLIKDNVASNQGGGIYVFEDGTKLSNGTTVNTAARTGEQMDLRMPHVFTSTIVANTAQQGGGIWFTSDVNSNARFNSVAVWQNVATDQANVHGMINPEQPTEDETLSEIFYPFSYSLIQDMRASGTNNLSTMSLNHEGVRFVNKGYDVDKGSEQTNIAEEKNETTLGARFADFGYYGLTTYSMLCSNGMPNTHYNKLKENFAIADDDFMGKSRIDQIYSNNFVEIGARALPKQMPANQLMLRLFVAYPDAVDTETATRFLRLNAGDEPGDKTSAAHKTWEAMKYYSQMGSSFACPFNFLQDAIDYITRARNGQITGLKLSDGTAATSDIVRNLPFEIILGSGTYYPRQSLNGETESVWAQTFAIPEGVTIIGGFNPQGGVGVGNPTYYGRYFKKGDIADGEGDIYTYVTPIPNDTRTPGGTEIGRGNKFGSETVTLPEIPGDAEHAHQDAKTITFQQWHIQDIADRRAMEDNNKNGIIEPWEFKYPTTISGNAVNGETDGVYHVMTAVADEDAVGRLPKIQSTNHEFVGSTVAAETGYQWKEEGQQIRLNGLIITGGNALTYLSTALDEYGKYIFYQGAGLQVDGNRYKNNKNNGLTGNAVFHNSAAYGVGYRDIPVSITNCQFRNNIAGYGGAISTNGSLSLFGSSFEQNLAIAQTETPDDGETWTTDVDPLHPGQTVSKVMYPGQGGAILATHQLSAFNTLFANNEARLGDGESQTIDLVLHPTFRVPDENKASATLRAVGGAIMMGSAAEHHIVNCDFVRNKANAYPAVFTMNPTFDQNPGKARDVEVNTHDYSQIINTVAWGNEVNPDMLAKFSGNENYQFASKLLVNVGKKSRRSIYIKDKEDRNFYVPEFSGTNTPTSQEDLDKVLPDAERGNEWQEAVWFCAYEEGTGFTPHNENDLRDAIVYRADRFAPDMIKDANNDVYQNCNILITSDNTDVAGPNFGYPSAKAGYDGFMEGADWSPSRYNALTDNGNGWIRQSVDAGTLAVTFQNDNGYYVNGNNADAGYNYQGAYPFTHYISDLTQPNPQFPEYKLWIALGNEKYMQATNDPVSGTLTINGTPIATPNRNLPRISPDPTLGVEKAYIDIGMYEYYKQPLLKPGSEVDILWVSTKEKPENGPANGATWKTPTSDLQRAIEALLSSRNGHKKEIRIMEGEYTPVKTHTISGQKYNAFVIDNLEMNKTAIVPSSWGSDATKDKYYAQSLTIKGGYSADIMYEYDPTQYKTVIRQKDAPVGTSTDHLFYVKDPIVRYYYSPSSAYIESNKYGATWSVNEADQSHIARTMPIQIDGLTLINDKVQTAGTQGSAIYYPNVDAETGSHTVSVNGEVTYYTDKNRNEISNKETEYFTTKIYYTSEANKTSDTRQAKNLPTEFFKESGDEKANPAKLVITKSQIIGSGKQGDANANASAVFIGANGGTALIYNTVFHSNQGMPLDAVNMVSINNTFAKNLGQVKLSGDGSEMHNSVMWMNNNGGTQTNLTSGDKFTYNSYSGGPSPEDSNHNIGLVAQNGNIAEGPNFVNPDQGTVEELNFDIKPSARLLNKGMDDSLEAKGNPDTNNGKYYTKVVAEHYDYALVSTTLKDVLFRNRLNSNNIDRGAYEFQGTLSNILYVDPNKSHSDAAQGLHWDDAFGYGDLQNAVDLASLSIGVSTPKSYVFVKGASATNEGLNTNETLILRDGVSVYGSVLSNYTDNHDMKKGGTGADKDHYKYGNATEFNIDAFISDLIEKREGVASSAASKTIVTGIKTAEEAVYTNNVTLADGFVVTDPGTPTQPVVDITNGSQNALIALRNIIVTGNDLSKAGSSPHVAQINNGLLYEALFYGNKQSSTGKTLMVGDKVHTTPSNYTTHGYAVSVTVEGDVNANNLQTQVDADYGNIYNSIINSIKNTDSNAAYGNLTNHHISGYYYNIDNGALNYQLTEKSKYIDQCSATVNPMSGVAGGKYAQFINYDTDRDLLGNPRLLSGLTKGKEGKFLDRGAFETWQVDNNFLCGDLGSIKDVQTPFDYKANAAGRYTTIKKQFYPHDGSVVYIMADKSLVIDPVDAEHEVKPTPHNPGFMLLQKGASCYGNGRPVTCAYLAVERYVRKGGAVVSMPYAMRYKSDVNHPRYDTAHENVLSLTPGSAEAYGYDGAARSDWKYNFRDASSPCWIPMSPGDRVDANNGVLYVPSDDMIRDYGTRLASGSGDNDNVLLRFTAKGTSLNDYIYTESANDGTNKKHISKTVTLTQYNAGGRDDNSNPSANTDDNADFTANEDMGWNAIGLPYLVSNYQPQSKITDPIATNNLYLTGASNAALKTATVGKYMMNIPHTLWMYYDGQKYSDGTTDVNGDGGFYSVSSWTDSDWHLGAGEAASIWVGEGFFTQTATLADTETLTFYRPIAPASFPSVGVKAERWYMTDEIREVEETTGKRIVATRYYTPDGILQAKPVKGVTIQVDYYDDGSQQSHKYMKR